MPQANPWVPRYSPFQSLLLSLQHLRTNFQQRRDPVRTAFGAASIGALGAASAYRYYKYNPKTSIRTATATKHKPKQQYKKPCYKVYRGKRYYSYRYCSKLKYL